MILIYTAALVLAAVQTPQEPPPQTDQTRSVSPEHLSERLESLLAAKDYTTLGQTIAKVSRQPDAVSDLAWLKSKMMEGNTAFVSMLYSRLLWVAAQNFPEEPKRQWRQTAVMASLYALAAIRVDGTRCGDRSAPAHRVNQVMTWNPELWPFARTLSDAERETLVKLAMAIEARTAEKREAMGDVEFLCRAGLEETQYNLEHGTAKEVTSAPGRIGRTVVLTGDGKYKPSERPEAERTAEAARVRASLPAELASFLAEPQAPHR